MKKCRGCGVTKPLDEFYRHPMMGDGRLNHCKTCKCAYQRKREAMLLANPISAAREHQRLRDKAKRQYYERRLTDPEGLKERMRRARDAWHERNPHKRRASNIVNNAVRDGWLEKPDSCSRCGKTDCRIEGHHPDYKKPLEVIWLCQDCHALNHRKHDAVPA